MGMPSLGMPACIARPCGRAARAWRYTFHIIHLVEMRCSSARSRAALRRASSASSANATAFVFLGAPGVGKGTFAGRLAKKLRIPAVSTGDIIRGEIKAGTPLGAKLAAVANAGGLVDDATVTAMVKTRLSAPDARGGSILVRAARRGGDRSPD